MLHALLTDYTMRTVALGSLALGAVSGTLGVFAVLRRQSLLGDAISHAALPGIVLAFMLTGSKASLVLVLGAGLAGWFGTLLVMGIVRTTRVPYESALGIILSVFFGFGLVLLTFLQRHAGAAQAGLDRFLFGQAATMVQHDVIVIVGLGALSLLTVGLFWKEFKLLSFDRDFGASVGLPMRGLDVLLTSVLVLAIVTGLQTVGVVLMSAMVVAPAAAARQWTDSLGRMTLISALLGGLAGISGALLSGSARGLPAGPTIVLCATLLVVISLALAPRRGLVWNGLRRRRQRREIRADTVLCNLYALSRHHPDSGHAHSVASLEAMSGLKGGARLTLEVLADRGLVSQAEDKGWALTGAGAEAAQRVLSGLRVLSGRDGPASP